MEKGKISYFDLQKGYGFISKLDGGEDIFLHVNDVDIEDSKLRPGAEVEFDIVESDRGLKALNVVIIKESPKANKNTMHSFEFIEDMTELLLDSSVDLTSKQILSIRKNLSDYAFHRGWVTK